MNASVVNCRGFPRELTAAGSNKIQKLTVKGHLSNLLVFFSLLKCVNNKFHGLVKKNLVTKGKKKKNKKQKKQKKTQYKV